MNGYGKEIARVSRCSKRLLKVARKLKAAKIEECPALVRRADRLLSRAHSLMTEIETA